MRRIVLVTLTLLLLAGCNGKSDDPKNDDKKTDGTSATPKPTGPPCEDIWKAGETLPEDYDSCVLDGEQAVQEVYKCLDGSKLVAFNDAYYAVTGEKIAHPEVAPMQDTPEYGKVYSDCTGE